ncbi:MAG: mannose-1-phosphate guanylyltransferase [Deltaproteobacteria bacterium]|nr:mannose-1-phosphate guanylyltransferase [Deltaproteobacteria bacterium]
MDKSLYFVVMAGGRGTRFWPRSRTKHPKQLLDIVGTKTILEQTIDRLLPITDWEHILIVTEISQAAAVKDLLPDLPETRLIIEPLGRNTAPCIGLAALILEAIDSSATMAVLPADHFISRVSSFQETLLAAAQAAQQGSPLITLGIPPTFPETGYGYLEKGMKVMEVKGHEVWEVKAFHEKPDRIKADAMLKTGRFFWNSGMFVWTVSAILERMARLTPAMYDELIKLKKFMGSPEWAEALTAGYEAMENISIDYAVMERADQVLMLEGDFGWNDVGSWEAVYQLKPKDEKGNCLTGPVFILDSQGCLVHSPQKTVALIGMEDLIVVDTPDALLICPRERAQEVKKIVQLLEDQGKFELL